MYVVVKNGRSVLSKGINKYTWKYLDECREYAASQCTSPEDVVEVCELNPVFTYSLDLQCTETEVKPHVCGDDCTCQTPEAPTEPVEPTPGEDNTQGEVTE